jgi:hypothetical protein
MSPTFTLTDVTGQTTETLDAPEPLEEGVDEEELPADVAPDAAVEVEAVPLTAIGVAPKASWYFVAATRLPLAAAVCLTFVVVACAVR